jgi:serine/threonine-protein kinase
MQLSRDASSLVVAIPDTSGRTDLWIFDLNRKGLRRRFTFDATPDTNPVWTRDGETIIWRSNRNGQWDLFRKPANGSGVDELLFQDAKPKTPFDVSPDGKVLLFGTLSASLASTDIWALPLDSANPPQPRAVVASPFAETDAEFYPDGKWIAYGSNESGVPEVYVTPYPGPGGKLQVSTATGMFPRWRSDGKELFYVTQTGDLMGAEIVMQQGALQVGTVERLFGGIVVDRSYLYAPAPDGKRFIVTQDTAAATAPPLTLIQNWKALVKR